MAWIGISFIIAGHLYSKCHEPSMRFLLTLFCTGQLMLALAQQTKYALVVGNGDYDYLEPLKNPVNDATDMSDLLTKMGFEVDVFTDVGKEAFQAAVEQFNQKSRNYDVLMFYYAGHGLEIGGKNYFVPVDAFASSLGEIKKTCVNANSIIYTMKSADSEANIIILDACRNNPFILVDSDNSHDGLALMDAPTGTIISFATAPGKVAYDGTGDNGLYTSALLQHLADFETEIKDVFENVRSTVVAKTRERQVPWESTSLTESLVLRPKPEVPLQLRILEGDSTTFEGQGELHAISNLQGVSFNWYYEGRQFTNGSLVEVKKTGNYQVKAISRQGQIKLSAPINVNIKSFVAPSPYILEGESISFNQGGKLNGKSNTTGKFNWLKDDNVVGNGPQLEVDIPGFYVFQVITREGEIANSKPISVRIKSK